MGGILPAENGSNGSPRYIKLKDHGRLGWLTNAGFSSGWKLFDMRNFLLGLFSTLVAHYFQSVEKKFELETVNSELGNRDSYVLSCCGCSESLI